tara:strand:- start:4460 stop:5704 length:1245 start_codon:yes stop_codon:yes gene_type:complete
MSRTIDFKFTKDDVEEILSPSCIRKKASFIYKAALEGNTFFKINEDKFDDVANYVLKTIKENYPELKIPYHSRWGHFNSEKKNRINILNEKLSSFDSIEISRREIDLVIVSVLLDAGAGEKWTYIDSETNEEISRSEGLAVASFDMFCKGAFSNLPDEDPLRVDAERLMNLTVEELEVGFQVSKNNPLEGVEGRLSLLKSLGSTILKNKKYFSTPRPGAIVDYFHSNVVEGDLESSEILSTLLNALGSIWPGRISLGGKNLGDVWVYKPLINSESVECLVPFHKLSQWLSYSLIESLEKSGLRVMHIDQLTGLAEYRNGGLFVDLGAFELRDKSLEQNSYHPQEDLIIEWRALTIIGLDKVASLIRQKLKLSSLDFPLPKILEGGTWHAGRKIAKSLRPGGGPPIKIISDGTVF